MKDSKGHGSDAGRVSSGARSFIPHTMPTNPQPGEVPASCGIVYDKGEFRRVVPGTA